jgi:hypothetical protein
MSAMPCPVEEDDPAASSGIVRNWCEDRWVPFLTQSSMEWAMLSLNARMVFPLLLRHVDRAGNLRLGRFGLKGIGALLRGPETTVSAGVRELIDGGLVRVADGYLSIANFAGSHLPNGRYVRLYTQDTADWLSLTFEARGLFCLMLRAANRAGCISLGHQGRKGLTRVVQAEWSELEGPLEELLTRGYGCVELHEFEDGTAKLVIPKFRAAQEARQTDAARQRASRERRRSGVAADHRAVAPAVASSAKPRPEEPPVAAAHRDVLPTMDADDDSAPPTLRDPVPWFLQMGAHREEEPPAVHEPVAQPPAQASPTPELQGADAPPAPPPPTERSLPAPIRTAAAEPAPPDPLTFDPSAVPDTIEPVVALLRLYPLFGPPEMARRIAEDIYGSIMASAILFGVVRDAVNDFALKNTSLAREEKWTEGRIGGSLGRYVNTAHRSAKERRFVDSPHRKNDGADKQERMAKKWLEQFSDIWYQRRGDPYKLAPDDLATAGVLARLCQEKGTQIQRDPLESFQRITEAYLDDDDAELLEKKHPLSLLPVRFGKYATDELLLPNVNPLIKARGRRATKGLRKIVDHWSQPRAAHAH